MRLILRIPNYFVCYIVSTWRRKEKRFLLVKLILFFIIITSQFITLSPTFSISCIKSKKHDCSKLLEEGFVLAISSSLKTIIHPLGYLEVANNRWVLYLATIVDAEAMCILSQVFLHGDKASLQTCMLYGCRCGCFFVTQRLKQSSELTENSGIIILAFWLKPIWILPHISQNTVAMTSVAYRVACAFLGAVLPRKIHWLDYSLVSCVNMVVFLAI